MDKCILGSKFKKLKETFKAKSPKVKNKQKNRSYKLKENVRSPRRGFPAAVSSAVPQMSQFVQPRSESLGRRPQPPPVDVRMSLSRQMSAPDLRLKQASSALNVSQRSGMPIGHYQQGMSMSRQNSKPDLRFINQQPNSSALNMSHRSAMPSNLHHQNRNISIQRQNSQTNLRSIVQPNSYLQNGTLRNTALMNSFHQNVNASLSRHNSNPNLRMVQPPRLSKVQSSEELMRNHYKPIQNSFKTQGSVYDELERDQSGFLRPIRPAPIVSNQISLKRLCEEKERHYIEKELMDHDRLTKIFLTCGLFNEVELHYHSKRWDEMCKKKLHELQSAEKKNFEAVEPLTQQAIPKDKYEDICNWVHTSAELPPDDIYNAGSYQEKQLPKISERLELVDDEEIDELHETGAIEKELEGSFFYRPNTFCLRDWTVLKGKGPTELMLLGTLIHVISKNIVEHNHKSSCIIDSGKDIVKTNLYTYILKGDFKDENNSIPAEIKKYFQLGGFPQNWKAIAQKWHDMETNRHNMDTTGYRQLPQRPKRPPPRYLSETDDKNTKRMKPSHENARSNHEQNIGRKIFTRSTPLRGKNVSSVLTRSATKRLQTRNFK